MNDKPPRRWLTFSLRSLFVLVLVVAAYFAGWRSATWMAEREKEAAVQKAVEELQAIRQLDDLIHALTARAYDFGPMSDEQFLAREQLLNKAVSDAKRIE